MKSLRIDSILVDSFWCDTQVIDDDSEDTTYMVLELLKLGPIMDMSRPHTVHAISESQSRVYFRQIALAVEYCQNSRRISICLSMCSFFKFFW